MTMPVWQYMLLAVLVVCTLLFLSIVVNALFGVDARQRSRKRTPPVIRVHTPDDEPPQSPQTLEDIDKPTKDPQGR